MSLIAQFAFAVSSAFLAYSASNNKDPIAISWWAFFTAIFAVSALHN